ncbi:MAG: hypothetical protein CFH01_00994 [Alphaproteobacteria bacterium MarineAlpha2_Bin1]|nr:MAG: hypothetical protein CFH01_00994 [Alphaproteobacteria bacterium MarineAlpha2_Bin1]
MKNFFYSSIVKIVKILKVNKKYYKLILIFLILNFISKTVFSDTITLKKGEDLYIEKKFDEAKYYFKKLVEFGNSNAETMTGIMYLKGQGYKSNASIAAIWFYKASLKGNKNAQLILGTQYLYGYGVKKNLQKAYTWLRLSSDSKNLIVSNQAIEFIKIIKNNIEINKFEDLENKKIRIQIKNHNFK